MLNERDELMNPHSMTPARGVRSNRIAWMLRIATLLGLAIVVGRVIQLEVAPGEKLKGFIASRTTSQTLHAVRGDLLDRRGRVLATTRIGYRVIVDPVGLHDAMKHDPSAMDRVIVDLGEVLELPVEQIAGRIITQMVRNEKIIAASKATPAREPTALGVLPVATIGAAQGTSSNTNAPKRSRYLPLGAPLDQERTQRIRDLIDEHRLSGVSLEAAPIRMQTGESLVGEIVGKVGFAPGASERTGVLGSEKLFDARLRGMDGSLSYVRDAKGQALWVKRGAWVESNKGGDVRLSIDLELQRMVHEQLVRGVEDADAAGGRAIVLDPNTGELLAMTDVRRQIPNLSEVDWWDPKSDTPRPTMPPKHDQPRYRVLKPDPNAEGEPALRHNRCLEDVYEPGSTFKPFAWTLAKSEGLLPDDEVLHINQKSIRTDYGRVISDVSVHSDLTHWDDVIKYSSNIGMSIATSRLGHDELRSTIKALGFGEKTGIGLAGEASGLVTSKENWSNFTQTSVGMGYEVAVTPIQMVRGFSVFARKGDLAGTLPEVRLTAAGDRGKPGMVANETFIERVFSSEAAHRTIVPMIEVVKRMDKIRVRQYPDDPKPRYSMFGKSGTSLIAMVPPSGLIRPKGTAGYFEKQHHSSFIVAAPADDPQVVVLVVIDDTGPERVADRHHFGSWVAGPVVRRIVEQALPYLGVSADPNTGSAPNTE